MLMIIFRISKINDLAKYVYLSIYSHLVELYVCIQKKHIISMNIIQQMRFTRIYWQNVEYTIIYYHSYITCIDLLYNSKYEIKCITQACANVNTTYGNKVLRNVCYEWKLNATCVECVTYRMRMEKKQWLKSFSSKVNSCK